MQKAAELRHQLGLDQSLPLQYWHFISGIAHGNFGMSLLYRQPVNSLVFRRIPVSLFLAAYAMVLDARSSPCRSASGRRRTGTNSPIT